MVKIRLARTGAKKKPFYHIVATSKKNPRDGRYIERLGFFNPVAIGGEVPLRLDIERVEYWQGQGAQLSERVTNLVKFFNRHGEGVPAMRAAPPESKAKDAKGQTTPAGATGDVSPAGPETEDTKADESSLGDINS